MTRNGKIARLPRQIRHELNTHLQDGELGKNLVEWLNSLPETQQLLSAEFEGRPINEQNLSDWRQGGFRDWLRQQEARERLDRFIDFSDTLDDEDDDEDEDDERYEQTVPERLSRVLAAELAAQTQQLLEETTNPKERYWYICKTLRQLHALRGADRAAAREARKQEDWEDEREQAEIDAIHAGHVKQVEKMKARETSHIWDSLRRSALVKAFGDGPAAKAAAEHLVNVERICNQEKPLPPLPPDPVPTKATKPRNANPIRHAQNHGPVETVPPAFPTRFLQSTLIKVNQA